MSADDAVAVFRPAATAYLALFRDAGLQRGETVHVGGGTGNVGRAAIELAVLGGARVVASARPEDADECASLGASAVVDYHDGAAAIAKAAPEGIDVYLDTSGHHDFDAALEVLPTGGRIVLMAGNAPVPLPVGNLYRRDASILGFVISDASVADLAAAAEIINQRLAAGGLKPRIARTMSLADTAEAHRLVEAREVRGAAAPYVRLVIVTLDGSPPCTRCSTGAPVRAADDSVTLRRRDAITEATIQAWAPLYSNQGWVVSTQIALRPTSSRCNTSS